jgi:hypothetical protein
MNFARRHLFIGKLRRNAARTEHAHWPNNEQGQFPEKNRDPTLPGITTNKELHNPLNQKKYLKNRFYVQRDQQ